MRPSDEGAPHGRSTRRRPGGPGRRIGDRAVLARTRTVRRDLRCPFRGDPSICRTAARAVRPRWVVPGISLAAAATVAVAVGTSVVGVVDHPAGKSPSARLADLSARQVLLAAAASSAKAPVTSGTYWFTYQQFGWSVPAQGKGGSYLVETRSERKDWTNAHSPRRTNAGTKAGRDGTTTHYWASRELGARCRPITRSRSAHPMPS